MTGVGPMLHPAFFLVVLDRARMQRCGKAVLDHLRLLEVREGGMKLLEATEIIENRLHHLVNDRVGNLGRRNEGRFHAKGLDILVVA